MGCTLLVQVFTGTCFHSPPLGNFLDPLKDLFEPRELESNATAVRFSLRKPSMPEDDLCYLTPGKPESLAACSFNSTSKTFLVIHGWTVSQRRSDHKPAAARPSQLALVFSLNVAIISASQARRQVSPCVVHLPLHLGDFADAFIKSDLQPFIHTFTHRRRSQLFRSSQGEASCSGTSRHSAKRSWGSNW